ncbi:MAG: ATP-dependent DNA helicase RecG [Pseudomonadota bacterium]
MRPAELNPLFAQTTRLAGVGPKIASLIEKIAGPSLVDLILTPPISFIDRSKRPTVAEALVNQRATLRVQIERHEPSSDRRRPYRVLCADETGFISLVYFHARADYLEKILPEGSTRLVSGTITDHNGAKQMAHPDHVVDPDKPEDMPLFEPVYPLTAGLTQGVMAKAMRGAAQRAPDLAEWQDLPWLNKNGWPSWLKAIQSMHAPESAADLSPASIARQRLAYDELLANQLALALIRRSRKKSKGRVFQPASELRAKANAALPFSLTGSQEKVLSDIDKDMQGPDRMVRLVQGDVGSGKTLVAFFAMLNAVEASAQAALMAPTEILARQHLSSLTPLADACGLTLSLLTGRDKPKQREANLNGIERGYVDIVIGTHALFQESVRFKDLGLVIVDEQHRFGVRQRLALSEKGADGEAEPHILVMTATPIPRTLALTAYGDMDVSAITEKPPGRKPVTTRIIPLERLDDVVAAVARSLQKGEQVYWVCPLVEESEVLALTAAEDRHAHLKQHFGDAAGLVHGKMPGVEKDAVMSAFYRGDLSILIATTVIEVGVDAPNATAIVIEHAERFGLAQLHQLRGRVGRGGKAGACLLLYKSPLGETSKARLEILRETEDGFRIAEEDLRLRGAGDLLGAAQSGLPQFQVADASAHSELLKAARDDAALILETDPNLSSSRGKALLTLLYLFRRDDAVKLLSAG